MRNYIQNSDLKIVKDSILAPSVSIWYECKEARDANIEIDKDGDDKVKWISRRDLVKNLLILVERQFLYHLQSLPMRNLAKTFIPLMTAKHSRFVWHTNLSNLPSYIHHLLNQ